MKRDERRRVEGRKKKRKKEKEDEKREEMEAGRRRFSGKISVRHSPGPRVTCQTAARCVLISKSVPGVAGSLVPSAAAEGMVFCSTR